MNKSASTGQEAADWIIKDISQLQQISLGVGAATCQVCGSSFGEGESVVVYVFRPAGEVTFRVGHAVCGGDEHRLLKRFTLGVRELLVEGRIGVCSDAGTQSSWLVLVAPVPLAVSAAATRSVRWIPPEVGEAVRASVEPDGESPVNGDGRCVERLSTDSSNECGGEVRR